MSDLPEQVVWKALKPVMPASSATYVAHLAVTALSKSGWIARKGSPEPAALPQPSEINWNTLTPEMFDLTD